MANPFPSGSLQWGRRISAAERPDGDCEQVIIARLQWGRRISAAESSRLVVRSGSRRDELQWGRRISAAESGS